MVKFDFFAFKLLTQSLKIKHSLQVTKSIGELLFFHFRVTNVKLIHEKIPINITVPMSVNP